MAAHFDRIPFGGLNNGDIIKIGNNHYYVSDAELDNDGNNRLVLLLDDGEYRPERVEIRITEYELSTYGLPITIVYRDREDDEPRGRKGKTKKRKTKGKSRTSRKSKSKRRKSRRRKSRRRKSRK
jgi:hypothetical protein